MSTRKQMVIDMLKETPNDAFLIYALALEEHKEGDTSAAIGRLYQLIIDHPDYLGSYYQLGKLYEEEQQIELAVSTYRKGLVKAVEQKAGKMERELKEAIFLIDDFTG